MFTIKFYSDDEGCQIIEEADSFSILRGNGEAEITLHRKNGDDVRRDIKPNFEGEPGWPRRFSKAIIENAAGRTTEIVVLHPLPPPNKGGTAPRTS